MHACMQDASRTSGANVNVQYTYNVILIAYEAHLKVPGQNFVQIACALPIRKTFGCGLFHS